MDVARAGESPGGAWAVVGLAFWVRLAVAAWAARTFPAAGDGLYYDVLAKRLAAGAGYTWLWPDGAITYVAHYPVGYPALIAAAYAVAGTHAVVAMGVNALFGAAMVAAVWRLGGVTPTARALAALAVALHPALVPYTAALMTEGVAAALLVVAVAVLRLRRGAIFAGAALGVATLVRPQCLLFAPLLGLLVSTRGSFAVRARAAAIVTAVTLLVCAPWTARNCIRMHRCALVSVNGGWNLLIGTQTTNGAWQPVDVPEGCRTVWDEAAKDECFGVAARQAIARAPTAWIARMPAKVAATLDYFGAAPWYLHESNPAAFGERAKVALGVVESVASYAFLLAALAGAGLAPGPRRRARMVVAGLGVVVAAALLHGWIAYLVLAIVIALFGRRWLGEAPVVVPATAIVVVVTAATHAVFFGAGRYGLVVVPFVTALPFALAPFGRRANPRPPDASASRAISPSSDPPSSFAAASSAASVAGEASRASALYW